MSDDAVIAYMTHWRAAFTGGGKGLLRKGTRIRISVHTSDPEPIGVYADPLERSLVEAALVPEKDRSGATYAGFSLFVKTVELNKLFHIISAGDNAT